MTFQIFCKHYLFFALYKAKRLPKRTSVLVCLVTVINQKYRADEFVSTFRRYNMLSGA